MVHHKNDKPSAFLWKVLLSINFLIRVYLGIEFELCSVMRRLGNSHLSVNREHMSSKGKVAKVAKKGIAKKGKVAGKVRRVSKKRTFSVYINRVLKQVHPKTGISKRSMAIMNSLVMDTFDKIAQEAGKLCKYTSKGTLSSREVQTAIRLVLPGELAKHAVSEGTKAVTKFSSA